MTIRYKGGTLIALVLTLAIFSYLFSKISFGAVLNSIRGADLNTFVLFLACSFSMNIFRCWRYLLLLNLSGYNPNKLALFMVVLIRNFCSDLLPARIGTLAYVALANKRLGVSLEAAVSGWAYSFVFDILALAPLVIFATLVFSTEAISTSGLITLSLVLAIVSFLVCYYLQSIAQFLKNKILDRFKHKPLQALSHKLDLLIAELARIKKPTIFIQLFLLSLMVRVFKYAAMYMLFFSIVRPWGYTFSTLPFAKVLLGTVSAELAASLPISGIAGFGLYQGVWSAVFTLLGFPERHAQITSLAHHLITQSYAVILAALAACVLFILPDSKRIETNNYQPRMITFLSKMLLLLGLISCLQYLLFHILESRAQVKKQVESVDISDQEQKQRQDLAGRLNLKLVFDSNRSGTFGIYKMELDGSNLVAIADSEQHESAPDPAPDGSQIVFAKALGLGRQAPSDIWIVNQDGTNARLLVEDGSDPTFSADGKKVFFLRQRKQVLSYELANSKLEIVFPKTSKQFVKGQLAMPRLSADQSGLVFTSDLPSRWHAWRIDLKDESAQILGNGCQPAWYYESLENIWATSRNALERTGFFRKTSDNKILKLVDFDAPWGHEYFAKLYREPSSNSDFIFYAACGPKQHDHDSANYQLFAYDTKSDQRVRLTFDPFTNRWPKVIHDIK